MPLKVELLAEIPPATDVDMLDLGDSVNSIAGQASKSVALVDACIGMAVPATAGAVPDLLPEASCITGLLESIVSDALDMREVQEPIGLVPAGEADAVTINAFINEIHSIEQAAALHKILMKAVHKAGRNRVQAAIAAGVRVLTWAWTAGQPPNPYLALFHRSDLHKPLTPLMQRLFDLGVAGSAVNPRLTIGSVMQEAFYMCYTRDLLPLTQVRRMKALVDALEPRTMKYSGPGIDAIQPPHAHGFAAFECLVHAFRAVPAAFVPPEAGIASVQPAPLPVPVPVPVAAQVAAPVPVVLPAAARALATVATATDASPSTLSAAPRLLCHNCLGTGHWKGGCPQRCILCQTAEPHARRKCPVVLASLARRTAPHGAAVRAGDGAAAQRRAQGGGRLTCAPRRR